MTKPVLSNRPTDRQRPIAGKIAERHWRFSFQYFKQVDYFGLGAKEASWFISLLEVLSQLSKKTPEQILSNPTEKMHWRCHPIDFSAKNAPLQRKQIDWIPKEITDNEEEFPLFQFHISKALGRVIGLWDEAGTFNILLLDPLHNMQPSQYNDHRLRETEIGHGEFSATISVLEEKMRLCASDRCVCRSVYPDVQSALNRTNSTTTVLVPLSEGIYQRATSVVKDGVADSIADLIELGLDTIQIENNA